MSDNNGHDAEPEPLPIIPGGPLDCQDCGEPMGQKMAAGFVKQEDNVMYVAGICPECMVDRLGLEWREVAQSTIVVPGAPPGMRPS